MKTKIDLASMEKAAKHVTERPQDSTLEEYWEYYNSIAPEANRVSFEEYRDFCNSFFERSRTLLYYHYSQENSPFVQ